jgi:hypothetical protein
MGRLESRIVVVILLFVIVTYIPVIQNVSGAISGYTKWNNWTIVASGGGVVNESDNVTNPYTSTWKIDGSSQKIYKNATTGRLRYNYDFNSSFNVTPPSQLLIGIVTTYDTSSESMNLSLYNWDTTLWDYINQTYLSIAVNTYTNTTISWADKNISKYINGVTGQIRLLVEDTNTTSGFPFLLQINYLTINATFSPVVNTVINLTNSTASSNDDGLNYTRPSSLNASADWNISNATAGRININASGNYSTHVLTLIGNNWTNYTFNLSNVSIFPLGGNITINISANDSWNQTNTSAVLRYFGLLSNASATALSVNESGSIVASTPVRMYCQATDTYSGVGVPGYNVSFFNGTAWFGNSSTNSTGWANATYYGNATASTGNYNLSCRIGNETGLWYYNSSDWWENTTMTVVSDSDKPVAPAFWIDSAGVNGSYRTNLYQNLTAYLNATDSTTSVSSVNMSILGPDGNVTTVSVGRYGSGTGWRYVFANNDSATAFALNQTGNYTINMSMMDLAGNANLTWNITFNVTNNYTVNLQNYTQGTAYNRGENLTFYVTDTNGIAVTGANITANLTYPTGAALTSGWMNYANDTYMLWLNSSFNVTNYTMKIVTVKGNISNNTAYAEFRFNVTNILSLRMANDSYRPSINTRIGLNDPQIRFYVNTTTGGRFLYNMTAANITCADGNNYTLTRDLTGNYHYNDTGCTSPNAYSTAFSIEMNVSDVANNNTGTATLSLTTAAAPASGSGSTGGGGGGGTVTKKCDTSWTDLGCGGVGGDRACGPLEMLQKASYSAGCDNMTEAYRCVPSPVFCEVNRRDFMFNVSGTDFVVVRGENLTVHSTVENTGNLTLELKLFVQKGCCSLDAPETVTAESLTQQSMPLVVHAPLNEALGDYLFVVSLNDSSGISRSRSFNVKVVESPLLANITAYKQELDKLKAEVNSYRNSGLDVSGIEGLINSLDSTLASSSSSISQDMLAQLREQVNSALADITQARAQLGSLALMKFLIDYKWWLVAAALAAFILAYLISEIAYPFIKLTREIRRMTDKEGAQVEARKATEKQYFMGKIDEKAFEDILIGKQSEILTTKGTARHKMQERDELVRKKLSPSAFKGWITSGFGLRRLAARLRKKKGTVQTVPQRQ